MIDDDILLDSTGKNVKKKCNFAHLYGYWNNGA